MHSLPKISALLLATTLAVGTQVTADLGGTSEPSMLFECAAELTSVYTTYRLPLEGLSQCPTVGEARAALEAQLEGNIECALCQVQADPPVCVPAAEVLVGVTFYDQGNGVWVCLFEQGDYSLGCTPCEP
jgi:hypothetical protein